MSSRVIRIRSKGKGGAEEWIGGIGFLTIIGGAVGGPAGALVTFLATSTVSIAGELIYRTINDADGRVRWELLPEEEKKDGE